MLTNKELHDMAIEITNLAHQIDDSIYKSTLKLETLVEYSVKIENNLYEILRDEETT